jgi:hypothetical protein
MTAFQHTDTFALCVRAQSTWQAASKHSLCAQAKKVSKAQQDAHDFVRQLATTSGAIEKRWKELGVPRGPRVAYLQQFPPFVMRQFLAQAELIHAAPGDILVSGEMVGRKGGVFLVLHGRVDLHSRWPSAARDASIV